MRRRSVLIGVLVVAVLVQGAPALAQENLQSGVQNLVRQIIAGMEQQQKRKLAILDFAKLDGSADNLTRYLTEQLATHMVIARRNFDVIERKHLDKILAEQGLNLSGIIEPQNARQVGRLSGVDAIATGSVTEHPTALEVTTRLIDTETGKVFAAAVTRFTKDVEVEALLGLGGRKQPEAERLPVVAPIPPLKPADDPRNLAFQTLRRVADIGRSVHVTPDSYQSTFLVPHPWLDGRSIETKAKVQFKDISRARFLKRGAFLFISSPQAFLFFRFRDVEFENPMAQQQSRSDRELQIIMVVDSNDNLAKLRSALEILSGKQMPELEE
ncbi:MAG: hypothetical protein HY574_10980 [candidate division NC10 bacterium]|nr:hypothetical protein [candidate division NC10 bacterium]